MFDYADASEEISMVSSSANSTTPTELNVPLVSSPPPASHEVTSFKSSSSSSSEKKLSSTEDIDESPHDGEILIGEAIVSVVTTKSVVNGTISVPVSPLPMTTEQILSPMIPSSTENPGINSTLDTSETTEDSRIVASVQTSRSISGARFLPFLVHEGSDKTSTDDEENASSPNDENSTDSIVGMLENFDMENSTTTTTTTKKTSLPVESTESIIDKLDRVQSELSSGFLASGFRNSGNTLQLDVLGDQRPQQTKKSFTTTSRTPIISKFVPRRYNQERKASTATSTTMTTTTTTTSSEPLKITEAFEDKNENVTTEKIKFRWPSSSRNWKPSTTESTPRNRFGSNLPKPKNPAPTLGSTVADISAFLPPGYTLKKEDAAITEKSILSDILAKSKIDISSLLPPGYDPKAADEKSKEEDTKEDEEKIPIEKSLESLFKKTKVDAFPSLLPAGYKPEEKVEEKISTTTESAKADKSLQDLFSKTNVDISALLPPGYGSRFKKVETGRTTTETTASKESSSETTTISMSPATTSKPAGGIKLVFPSRPGGRKAVAKATTHNSRSDVGGSGPVTPRIQKGWPTR